MRILLGLLLALLLGLQVTWWFGKGGKRDVWKLEAQITEQEQTLEKLRLRNSKLAAEVMDLKEGLDAVEEIARSEMGMVKEGEIFYQILELAPDTATNETKHADEE
ncbi:MAG: cell division protein FtsB [Gammaproteobacteria bacterium]|nr:cell division protein FtsB [Gammaproteobacteria bacterium]